MKKILILLLFTRLQLSAQTNNIDLIARLQVTTPTVALGDGIGGQLGVRLSTEYAPRQRFGFEVVFDERRYSIGDLNTKGLLDLKSIQVGFPFAFGETIRFRIMPCLAFRASTKMVVSQNGKKTKLANSDTQKLPVSGHDKIIMAGVSKRVNQRLALECSALYIFAPVSRYSFSVGIAYQL